MAQVGQSDLGVIDGQVEVGIFLRLIGHVGCSGGCGRLSRGHPLVGLGAVAIGGVFRRIRLNLPLQTGQHLQVVFLIDAVWQRV